MGILIMTVGISIATWLQQGMIAFPSCAVQPSLMDSSVLRCVIHVLGNEEGDIHTV